MDLKEMMSRMDTMHATTEQLAYFINLYHLMTQHAFLVLGPPASPQQWLSLYHIVAYQTVDDIFSLAELEHCILRAAMHAPSGLHPKFSVPRSSFACALSRRDWRLSFVLNSGSLSVPSVVPVYVPAELNKQLDLASTFFLSNVIQVQMLSNRAGVIVVLPKVMQWYQRDFGRGTAFDCVRAAAMYLSEQKCKLLELFVFEVDPQRRRIKRVVAALL